MMAIAPDLLEAAVNRLPQDALTPARKSAMAYFVKSGFPTLKDEDWKYTNLSRAAEFSNVWLRNDAADRARSGLTQAADEAADEVRRGIDAHWVVFSDGGAAFGKAPAIDFERLSERPIGDAIIADDHMTSFNAALLRDGLRITVHPSSATRKPLGLLFVDVAGDLSQARVLIDVDEFFRWLDEQNGR